MTPIDHIRLVQAAMLAVIVALFVGPSSAFGKSMPGAVPDAFERYAAAHPYGQGVIDTSKAPDAFERYAAAYPYGQGVIDTNQAPDVFERYVKSHGSTSTVVVDGGLRTRAMQARRSNRSRSSPPAASTGLTPASAPRRAPG